ncbi:calcium-binding protein, partial [Microcystis sp. LE19-59.1C]
LYGNGGNDVIYGGTGNDNAYGGIGDDWLYGEDGNDKLFGDDGQDYLSGGAGDDTLTGGLGDDYLIGDAGNNVLGGGWGNDVLIGGLGIDVLAGGQENDTLTGGANADFFDFYSPTYGVDWITDFSVIDDTILVYKTAFGLSSSGAILSNQFSIGSSATTASHRFIYDSVNGALFFDSDGLGGTAQIQIALLNTGLLLTNNDIVAT